MELFMQVAGWNPAVLVSSLSQLTAVEAIMTEANATAPGRVMTR